MSRSMATLHAQVMATTLAPSPDPVVHRLREYLLTYQQNAHSVEHLVALGWVAKAEMAPLHDEHALFKGLALLLALIRWRIGPGQFARIFPRVTWSA